MENNPDLVMYNNLNTQSISKLVERVRKIEITRHNLERESDMIRNILIMRGEYVPTHYVTDLEHAKLYSIDSSE